MRASWLVLVSLAVGSSGCGSSSDDSDDDDDQPAIDAGPVVDAAPYVAPEGYTLTPFLSTTPEHTFAAAGSATTAGKDYQAVIETDRGRLVLDLLEAQTPITVNSFVWLALHHYFDGVAFHRVIEGFMAQGGDPNTLNANTAAWGSGGPGYGYGLEIVAELVYDRPGMVGMARTDDPNSNGSQFFIALAPAPFLNGNYTIFAEVSEGLEVLPLLVRGEPPANPTRIQRVFIVEKAAP